jgi:dTDP-glucose 4,6-dehydratase
VNEMQIENSRIMNKTETVIVRIFNTYGPGEWYHPFRSVNCTFTYNLLHGKPIKVFKGHTRTSTYIYDAVNAMANICERFDNGAYYNIASSERHSIERLAELIIKYTGADPNLVEYSQHKEILTTKDKIVENNKVTYQLGFKSTVTLEEGIKNTVDWMKKYYNIEG